MNLPIEDFREKIIKSVKENQITIIKGPTGCGKSTIVPLILSDHFNKIALIEPRRIAVHALFKRLRNKNVVGYKMRFDKNISEDNKIVIFTDGMFLNENNEYDVVILDEIHERTLRMDLIMALCKHNKQKLVLMSANIDTLKLTSFFNCEIIEITTQQYPINIFYEDFPICDYIKTSYQRIKEINSKKIKGDILCFLPGEEDINELYNLCQNISYSKIYKIHSTISDFEQQKIFERSEFRKIILATNICESSLTIPGVTFVIDTGLKKSKIVNVTTKLTSLICFGIEKISKESAEQRAGRSNREGKGYCYRLYTKDSYNKFINSTPEIIKSELKEFLLYLIYKKIDFLNIKFVDPPNLRHVKEALLFLWENELINLNDKSFKITTKGIEVLKLPLTTNLGLFLYECRQNNLGNKGAMLVALISLENYNFFPKFRKENDLKYLIRIIKEFIVSDNKLDYCITNRLPFKGMEKAYIIYKQLQPKDDDEDDCIERLFSSVFWYNASDKQKNGSFLNRKTESTVYWHGNERRITYIDTFYNNKPYTRITSKYYE